MLHVFDLIAIISKETVCFFLFQSFLLNVHIVLMPQIVTSLPSQQTRTPTSHPQKIITHISPILELLVCIVAASLFIFMHLPSLRQIPWLQGQGGSRFETRHGGSQVSVEIRGSSSRKNGGLPRQRFGEGDESKGPVNSSCWAQEGWNWWCEFFVENLLSIDAVDGSIQCKNIGNHGIIPDIY